MVHRQVVYRLLPRTRGRWRRLERLLEAQRQLYNAALEERIDCWRKAGRSVSWQDQFRSLTVCRREIPEMAADPVAVQRGTPDQVRGMLLKRLDEAYRGFFRRVKAGEAPGFPRFRGRRRWNSLSVVSGVRLEADPRSRRRQASTGSSWTRAGRSCARCWNTRPGRWWRWTRATPAGPAMPAGTPTPGRAAPGTGSNARVEPAPAPEPGAMPTTPTSMQRRTYWPWGPGPLRGEAAGLPGLRTAKTHGSRRRENVVKPSL